MKKSNSQAQINESIKATAVRALRAISKSSVSALMLEEVPKELLFGDEIDFSQWSLVLTDKNLKYLSEQSLTEKRFLLDSSKPDLKDFFHSFYNPLIFNNGIISLNIQSAKDVTDYGITLVARKSPNLKSLNITGCSNITDVGLREVGLNCCNIQDLILSSCQSIDGSGLVSFAECCRYLLKLDVSKCRKMETWCLKKVFYECIRLEEVNVSYLKNIGDEEIRVLAQNCPHLVSLRAVECPYISDESMLVLAQHCNDLDLVDLSRTQMAYRITDTCISAFAQRCPSLRALYLNGCDQISDVGLTWLSEGCKTIEELELNRCTKVIKN